MLNPLNIDYHRRAVVPLINRETGRTEFDVIIYGYTAAELQVVPPPAPITSLARRYPDHVSSPFALWSFE